MAENSKKQRQGLQPSISVGIKLASIAVHAEELIDNGHELDVAAVRGLLLDSEVVMYLNRLRPLALLPVKR